MSRVLVVEDDACLTTTLESLLHLEGFEVDTSSAGDEALRRLTGKPYDVVVLDVALPGCDGYEVCRTLRSREVRIPVLMLTARVAASERIRGFESGADDYVTKPFDASELMCRIRALLRRWSDPQWARLAKYCFDAVSVDFVHGHVTRAGVPVGLSAKELHLLRELIARRGSVLSRQELMRSVWGYEGALTRTLDVHVATLRRKVEENPDAPRHIQTVRGEGYTFVD